MVASTIAKKLTLMIKSLSDLKMIIMMKNIKKQTLSSEGKNHNLKILPYPEFPLDDLLMRDLTNA